MLFLGWVGMHRKRGTIKEVQKWNETKAQREEETMEAAGVGTGS